MKAEGWSAKVKLSVVGVAVVLVLIVAFQNTDPMGVRILFWQLRMAKMAILAAVFVAGTIAGGLGTLAVRARRK